MDVDRQIAQQRARIALMRRDAVIGGLILAALVVLTVCAFVLKWHPLLKAFLLIPTLGMLAHSAAPYTRMKEHRRKLVELETRKGGDSASGVP